MVFAGEQDIGGLDVAVQHPASVSCIESGAHLADNTRGPKRLDPPLGSDQRAQVGAVDKTHRDEEHAVLVAGLEDGNDVWVVDRGRDLRLAPKALAEAVVPGVLGEDEFERHPALERELSNVSQCGTANDNEELELGVRCMASGLYDDQGTLVAGLSISAPSSRLQEDWLPKLQATTRDISTILGYKPKGG